MNAIAKTIRTRIPLFSFTSRGFLGFMLVLGLLLAIFFLPDLAGFHANRTRVETPAEVAVPTAREVSPLSAILDQVNQMGERKPFEPNVREAANRTIQEAPAITWDVIRSESVKLAINKARTEVAQIIDVVPPEKTFSRFALANYQLALEQLSSARDDRFRALDALAYIRYLDREVTNRFEEEGVSGQALKQWTEVNLGDALKSGESRIYREDAVTPFDPQFSLNHLTLTVPADNAPAFNPQFAPPSSMAIEGSLVYRGIKSIKVFHNRRFVQDIPLPRPSKHSTDKHGFFRTTLDSAFGSFSFRVESEDGEVYIKEYSFYPKLFSVVQKNPFGQYTLGRGRERTVAFDRTFVRSISRPRTDVDGMVPF